jgi:hypothetical protein
MDDFEDNEQSALPPSEVAREKRRDRDTQARARAGMRTGLAKQFKQVLDSQRRRAEEDEPPPRHGRRHAT